MSFVDVVIAVCLSAQPNVCEEQRLTFESHGSLRQCMAEAMPYIAQWAGLHPQWRVVRWRCEFMDGNDRQI
jgi:hypothetical protein